MQRLLIIILLTISAQSFGSTEKYTSVDANKILDTITKCEVQALNNKNGWWSEDCEAELENLYSEYDRDFICQYDDDIDCE